MKRDHRGSATPLVVALVVLSASFVIVLGRLGTAAVSRAQARTAADAAALAGAAEGRQAAEEVATANGGHLERFEQAGADTEVTVTVGEARATSRARRGTPHRELDVAEEGHPERR